MSDHVHRSYDTEALQSNHHHTTNSITPYSAVEVQSSLNESRVVPSAQAVALHCMRRPGGTIVQSDNPILGSTFNGTSNYTDYILPGDGLHIVENLFLSWTVTHTAAAANDELTAKAAWQMVDRYELFFGNTGNVTASVRGQDAHLLWLGMTDDSKYRLEAAAYGMQPGNRAAVEASFPAAAAE